MQPPDPKEAAQQLLERKKMREHFLPFLLKSMSTVLAPRVVLDLEDSWHIRYLCEVAEALYTGELRKVVINIPPRELKSIIFSICLPAWVLGKRPDWSILCASYNEKLATSLSVKGRRVMESGWYSSLFPETILSDDQNSKVKIDTTQAGGRIACGVGGTILGEGGVIRILDDPHKVEVAMSDTQREADIEWLYSTWLTRENDPNETRDVLIMQRLHYSDLSAECINNLGWESITLPRVATKREVIIFPVSGERKYRAPGELLNPLRYNEEKVALTRKNSYVFESQQQQNPQPLGGGRIKIEWLLRYEILPPVVEERVMSIDTAGKTKEINDPSVAIVFARVGAVWYLETIWEDRIAYPDLKYKVLDLFRLYNPSNVLIEDKSSGISLIQDLRAEKGFDGGIHAIAHRITPILPKGEKPVRMETASIFIENGLLSVPSDKIADRHPWLSRLLSDLAYFPDNKQWDILDALSQFLTWQGDRRVTIAMPGTLGEKRSWKIK